MTLAVIARADAGGLSAQTWEIARHVAPDKVLVLVLGDGRGRGKDHPERFDGLAPDIRVSAGDVDRGDLKWLLDRTTTVYTAEGPYNDSLGAYCTGAGARLVIHANPELWVERYRDTTTEVVCPTAWEIDRVPGARHMPMPVDRERVPYRLRTKALTFWHPKAPAFEDRHGSDIVEEAIELIDVPCRVLVTGEQHRPHDTRRTRRTGKVTVERRGNRENYWDGYEEADVLILPRRYGGLSLPVQEALSSGMPVVMLDTGPYAGQGGVLTIPSIGTREAWMKGGIFPVHTGDPQALADQIGELVRDPSLVERASKAADETAAALSWFVWERPWRTFLHG